MSIPGEGIGFRMKNDVHVTFSDKMHLAAETISRSGLFNGFIMFIIFVNAIVVGLETNVTWKLEYSREFEYLDYTFLLVYTVEFVLKLYADKRTYWSSAYNIFDFVILMLSFLHVLLHLLQVEGGVLKILRLLRALRTLRTISFIEGLQVLVIALIDTIRNSVLNVVILLAMLMLFFGVVGYYIFGYDETGDQQRWGDLSLAMMTLFTFVTADGWTDIQKSLDTKYPGSRWFTVVFIFLGHFIFTNLFIGIIIMNIHEATEKFENIQRRERETQLKLKKKYLYKRQHDDVREMLEKQKSSQYTNFEEMTKSFYETLRPDDFLIMDDVPTSLRWMETYLDSLDHADMYMHRVQQCHRNIALILGEMAERGLRKQHGLDKDDTDNALLRASQASMNPAMPTSTFIIKPTCEKIPVINTFGELPEAASVLIVAPIEVAHSIILPAINAEMPVFQTDDHTEDDHQQGPSSSS